MGPLGVSSANIGLTNNAIVDGIIVATFSKEVYRAVPPLVGPLGASSITNLISYIIHQRWP